MFTCHHVLLEGINSLVVNFLQRNIYCSSFFKIKLISTTTIKIVIIEINYFVYKEKWWLSYRCAWIKIYKCLNIDSNCTLWTEQCHSNILSFVFVILGPSTQCAILWGLYHLAANSMNIKALFESLSPSKQDTNCMELLELVTIDNHEWKTCCLWKYASTFFV